MPVDQSAGVEGSIAGAPRAEAGDALGHGRLIWLYDGLCGFCDGSVRFFLAHERPAPGSASPCVFVAIQSEAGRRLALRHGVDPNDPSTFLFIEDGVAHASSDGVIALARHLRQPWRLLALWRLLPKGFRDRQYGWVARNRYRIAGRKVRCGIPAPSLRARFVLPD